jgi:hypothetical protein
MRLIQITTLFVLALAILPSTMGAQQQPQKKILTSKEIVAACVLIVRSKYKASQFDAYIGPDGGVRRFGTSEEHFGFQKCMNDKGHSID